MNKILSKERVGQYVSRAAVALFLAGAVKAFIHLRSDTQTPQESGGWTDLTLDYKQDHPDIFDRLEQQMKQAELVQTETER